MTVAGARSWPVSQGGWIAAALRDAHPGWGYPPRSLRRGGRWIGGTLVVVGDRGHLAGNQVNGSPLCRPAMQRGIGIMSPYFPISPISYFSYFPLFPPFPRIYSTLFIDNKL